VVVVFQLHYISPYVNSGTASPASGPMSVFAYIGTPPSLRRLSRLLWRQGPCYLIEDVVAMPVIQTLHRLGPNYVGSLQAPGIHCVMYWVKCCGYAVVKHYWSCVRSTHFVTRTIQTFETLQSGPAFPPLQLTSSVCCDDRMADEGTLQELFSTRLCTTVVQLLAHTQ